MASKHREKRDREEKVPAQIPLLEDVVEVHEFPGTLAPGHEQANYTLDLDSDPPRAGDLFEALGITLRVAASNTEASTVGGGEWDESQYSPEIVRDLRDELTVLLDDLGQDPTFNQS